MSCQELEDIITDLACGGLLEAGAHHDALNHTAACPKCRSRLANERALTLKLRLVAEAEDERAPARVKEALRAAFNERAAQRVSSVVVLTPKKTSAHLSYWVMAAAAALLVMFSLATAPRWLRLFKSEQKEMASQTPQQLEALPQLSVSQASITEPTKSIAQTNTDAQKRTTVSRSARASVKISRRSERVSESARAQVAKSSADIAKDFVPLTYVADKQAMESGQIVRVTIPRSTLLSLGLPMNIEHAGELVKAEVLLGDDGVARAIRLVE